MKSCRFLGIMKYTAAGFILGFVLISFGMWLNYHNGFAGPWYKIFEHSPDFIIVVFSPLYLSIISSFMGFKKEQLVFFNNRIKESLSQEQHLSSAADLQVKLQAKILSQINEAIAILDGQGRVEWINESFTETNGYALAEVKGKKLKNILRGPLTDQGIVKPMLASLATGKAVAEEILVYDKCGTPHWHSLRIRPIFDDADAIVNFIAIHNDISGRKQKEFAIEKLYKEVADYKFALDQSSIVIIFNIDGKINHVNKKFCEVNGLEEEELLGRDYRSISISMRDKAIVKPIWDKLVEGQTWKGELVNRSKNGKTYWADTTIVPLLDTDGKPCQFLVIQQDITERKTLENQLLSNKNKLEQAVQVARLGTWEVDADGNYAFSAELRHLYHLPPEGFISREEIYDKIHPDDRALIKEKISRSRADMQKVEIEYRYMVAGETRFMILNHSPVNNEAGEYIGAFGTVQDITAAKLSALALKKSEEEKSAVFSNTQTIICLHDMQGNLLDINTAAEKTSGFTKEEVVGMNLKMIIAPENYGEFDKYIHTINNNETATGTMQVYTKQGVKRVWLYQNAVYANNGNQPYVIASAIDITESVKAQNEIDKQQQFIRQIIDNSPNVIFVMNEERRIVLANHTFEKYYTYDEKEMPFAKSLSHGPEDIFLGDVDSIFELEDGEMIRLEGSLKHPVTEAMSWFSIINKCFKEKNGKKYILVFGMDFTGRYQVETDLIAANALVEKSLKVKDQFISNMSHEIRTPLNAVIGFTDLLSETSLNKEQTGFVDIVKTASANLLALINNILDLSKIESSNLALETLPIDLCKIVQDVSKILEPKARAKGIQMNTRLDPELPAKVLGDQLRLTQVMFNLIGNAVKFTDRGSIDIECGMSCGPDKLKDYVSFRVKDTGIGVPKDKQKDIFERFTQANTNTQRLYGGTGLGLNIAKGIIDLYGGTLTMESEDGKGTAFHFVIPFRKYTELQTANGEKALDYEKIFSFNKQSPMKVLLAEDNAVNAMLATQVLTKKGFVLKHVVNGELAVDAVQQQHFDLVLMDIQMPVMNGIDASIAIRQLNGDISQIPIIAMTAHSLNGEMQNCYNAGMNGYVTKPFKADDLFSTIYAAVVKTKEDKQVAAAAPN